MRIDQHTVAAAVIRDADNRLLITKRLEDAHLGGLWEFPGGKVERGETCKDALAREIREELGVTILVGERLVETEFVYGDRRVALNFFECVIVEGVPMPMSAAELRWVEPNRLNQFEFPEGNKPLLERLLGPAISEGRS